MDEAMTRLDEFLEEWHSTDEYITVRTSGSTGEPKLMKVEKNRMRASAEKTCRFLGLRPGDSALLCMPLDYIAGKMMVVRSIIGGLKLVSVKPSSHPLRGLTESPEFSAMVPLQVAACMDSEEELHLLKGIKHLIIGGGAIDPVLERILKGFPNAVWSTYGMTETLSHIAMRRVSGPDASLWYEPMPGVEVSLVDGCLKIIAPDVAAEPLQTNDLAELSPDGKRFRILGRKDNVVDTGGIKVRIEDVERLLRPAIDCDFAVTRRPDERLGEELVLALAASHLSTEEEKSLIAVVRQAAEQMIENKYWRPRCYIIVDNIPHTATGKIARAEMERLVLETHSYHSVYRRRAKA